MEQYKVTYSAEALDDLKDIFSYIAFKLKVYQTAVNQTNRIRKAIKNLGNFPLRNSKVEWEPWSSAGMRKMPVDNFVIYYFADEEEQAVMVVRIFYGGRNVEEIIASANDDNE